MTAEEYLAALNEQKKEQQQPKKELKQVARNIWDSFDLHMDETMRSLNQGMRILDEEIESNDRWHHQELFQEPLHRTLITSSENLINEGIRNNIDDIRDLSDDHQEKILSIAIRYVNTESNNVRSTKSDIIFIKNKLEAFLCTYMYKYYPYLRSQIKINHSYNEASLSARFDLNINEKYFGAIGVYYR